MISTNQLDQIAVFVKDFLFESIKTSDQEWVQSFPRAAEHRWQHTLNVLKNAEHILEGEGENPDQKSIVRAAVLLHDVSMFTCDHKIHGRVSAEIAREYLEKEGYDKEFIDPVCLAIEEHGTDFGDLPPEEQGKQFSWAGKVVVEADILDKLGASAVTSNLLYLGDQKKQNFEVHRELSSGLGYERATFFKEYFWTDTGKQMAQHRYAFFIEFLDRLKEEVVEYDIPSWTD